jgi:hypothetical protein
MMRKNVMHTRECVNVGYFESVFVFPFFILGGRFLFGLVTRHRLDTTAATLFWGFIRYVITLGKPCRQDAIAHGEIFVFSIL